MTERKTVVWRPEWSPDEEAQVQALVEQIRSSVSALRFLREQRRLTQSQVAEALGTTQSNVSKLERGGADSLAMLRAVVQHEGGELVVLAKFPDETLELPL